MSTKWVGARAAHVGLMALLLAGASGAALAQTPQAAPAAAPAPDSKEARIEQLENEVQQLADEVADLKRSQAEQIVTLSNVETAQQKSPPPAASVGFVNGRPTFSAADGRFTATSSTA